MIISYKKVTVLKVLFSMFMILALFLFVINSWEYLKLVYALNYFSSPKYLIFYSPYVLFNSLPWLYYFLIANKSFFYDELSNTIYYSNSITLRKFKIEDVKKSVLTRSKIILFLSNEKVVIDKNMQNADKLYKKIEPGVQLLNPKQWKSGLYISIYNAILILFVNLGIFFEQVLDFSK